MTAHHIVTPNDIGVIICIAFDRRAAPSEIAAFKDAMVKCHSVLRAVELSGTFDFMVEATLPNMEAYSAQLILCAGTVARLVDRYETNFVCKRYICVHESEHDIWVPTPFGVVRIDSSVIDKVTAEGDYMRVHSAGQSWVLHSTMHALSERLDSDDFIQLHRSVIVRRDFIGEFVHLGRNWTAVLNDGTNERVAKRSVPSMHQMVQSDSTKAQRQPPKYDELV